MVSMGMQNGMPTQLTDSQLLAEVARLASCERQTTAALIAHLAELQARRLYLGAGFSSMFTYCTRALRLSEGGAYNRIEVARAVRRFPVILALLEQGALSLATARLLAPLLTEESHRELLAAFSYKSRREVEAFVRSRNPRPDVAPSVRRLPPAAPPSSPGPAERATAGPLAVGAHPLRGSADPAPRPALAAPSSATRQQVVAPLAPDRYHVRFTASAAACEKLKRAQALLRHTVPSGDPGEIFDRALTALLDVLERRKLGAVDHPRPSGGQAAASRNIPAEVKRAVVDRDGGSCAFVGSTGRRCGERGFLEFHHVVPYARGGAPSIKNVQLRCRAHNGYEAELVFGRWRGLAPGRVPSPQARGGPAPPGGAPTVG
jgi:hypothetical protein